MPHTISRADLADFFQPHAALAHKNSERVHIHCSLPTELGDPANEWAHYCAGYVCEVTDTAVFKYVSGTNSDSAIPFGTINRVTIHNIAGECLREYRVVELECVDSWKPNKNAAAVAYNRERGLQAPSPGPSHPTSECEPTYTLDKHITQDVKARAAAEWDAMDEFGRLPGDAS